MILESMFDIIRVENSKLTSQNINSPPSLLVISYKVSLENLVLHRLHLSFHLTQFQFQAVPQPRTQSLRSSWLAVRNMVTLEKNSYWMSGLPHELRIPSWRTRGSIESLVFYSSFARFHVKFYAVVCYGICGFGKAVFGQEKQSQRKPS